MKNKFILAITSSLFCLSTYAQSQLDSIFTNEGPLAVNLKEITPDAIKFSYPNEDLVISMYKNSIFKIIHKSGRVEVFNEASSFKIVTGSADWENVSISRVESELQGLFKLEEVTSKATGATVYSNVNRVMDRAYRKLKIEAAMLGGNIVYLLEQQTKGVSQTIGGTDPARTSLSGVAYTNMRPNFNDFAEIISVKSSFVCQQMDFLGNNSTDVRTDSYYNQLIEISELENSGGFIKVKTNLSGLKEDWLRVTYFDDQKIILMYRNDRKIVNYILAR